jgi:hypothetical protein
MRDGVLGSPRGLQTDLEHYVQRWRLALTGTGGSMMFLRILAAANMTTGVSAPALPPWSCPSCEYKSYTEMLLQVCSPAD